jgi:hypothetical protein
MFDSQGLLFVDGRTNSPIEIFDQEGETLANGKQFCRPSPGTSTRTTPYM